MKATYSADMSYVACTARTERHFSGKAKFDQPSLIVLSFGSN